MMDCWKCSCSETETMMISLPTMYIRLLLTRTLVGIILIAMMMMMLMMVVKMTPSPRNFPNSFTVPLWNDAQLSSSMMISQQHLHLNHHPSYLKVATSSLLMTSMTDSENDDNLSSFSSTSSHDESMVTQDGIFLTNSQNSDNENHNNLYPCRRSNSTYIVWYTTTTTTPFHDDDGDNDPLVRFTCTWQTIRDAKIAAYKYLRQHVMSFDIPFLETMGFHDDDDDDDDNDDSSSTDGLTNGMIGPVIDLALTTKMNFLYTDIVPQSIFYEYILNYANVNENRNNIRPYIYEYLIQPLFLPKTTTPSSSSSPPPPLQSPVPNYTMTEAIWKINANMWRMLAPSKHTDCIRFVSGQTPIIFDPMSVLTFGYGSCTGISILFVQALRAAGIPARLAGTPAWNQNPQHGNHNWVEVWIPTVSPPYASEKITGIQLDPTIYSSLLEASAVNDDDSGGVWLFIEGSPNMTTVDSITDQWNPCDHFLCEPGRQINQTQYFAANLDHNTTSYFPLAWDIQNQAVPAVNRTLFYHTICAQCK